MKNNLLFLFFLAVVGNGSAQIKVGGSTVTEYEYATVLCRVYYQSNTIIYDESGISKSPLIYQPSKEPFILKYEKSGKIYNFSNITELLNYLGSSGWKLVNTTVLSYEGDDGNQSKSRIINSNEYMQQLIFERIITK